MAVKPAKVRGEKTREVLIGVYTKSMRSRVRRKIMDKPKWLG